MVISKTRIRSVENYLVDIPEGSEFRPVAEVTETNEHKLTRIGFGEPPQHGDTVLPPSLGPISRFNAEGKWEIHRDEPKEERYIRTVRWTWKQWSGHGTTEEHEDFRDIYRDCFPRSHHSPPGIELTFVEYGERQIVIAPTMINTLDNHPQIAHAINLLLELLGECDLVKADLSRFDAVKMTRLNWKMLPPGEHPWEHIRDHLQASLKRTSDNTQSVIRDRQETILAHGPAQQAVGLGGFSDYIAYIFPERKLVVLECIRLGNAIYVFNEDWQHVAKLTKAEILNESLHVARIVHAGDWKQRLASLLARAT